MVRRRLEQEWASADGSLLLVARDWAKAFDSIDPKGLVRALERFGVPKHFVRVVTNIYTDRKFVVSDCGHTSEAAPFRFGICQGCPLSPFLFTIVMTCLMTDARQIVSNELGAETAKKLTELLYADDTLLMGKSGPAVTAYLRAVAEAGSEYGLALHVGKTQVLQVRSDEEVRAPTGEPLDVKASLVYLGALVSDDGRAESELSRRLGLAAADFKVLERVWAHTSLPVARKLRIFQACVLAVLVYGLKTSWLNTAARRRIDGFQARCLRRILRVPAAYYSRIPNTSVRDRARTRPLSNMLLERQLLMFGEIARMDGGPLRDTVFAPGKVELAELAGRRRRGRPRHTWAKQLQMLAVEAAGGTANLRNIIMSDAASWRRVVTEFLTLRFAHATREASAVA